MNSTEGYVLSIDQASNSAGVSLWYNSDLIAVTTLNSVSKSQKLSRRLQTQVEQLTQFLLMHLPKSTVIKQVIFEDVRSKYVVLTIGAFLCCPFMDVALTKSSFVASRSWKSWARIHGAHSQDFANIKGFVALREIKELEKYHWINQEDVADSVLMFFTWKGQKK